MSLVVRLDPALLLSVCGRYRMSKAGSFQDLHEHNLNGARQSHAEPLSEGRPEEGADPVDTERQGRLACIEGTGRKRCPEAGPLDSPAVASPKSRPTTLPQVLGGVVRLHSPVAAMLAGGRCTSRLAVRFNEGHAYALDLVDYDQLGGNALYTPMHPGFVLRETCLNGLSVAEVASRLGVASEILERLIEGACSLSPEIALRLEAAGWSNAEFWMRVQVYYDLANERLRRVGDSEPSESPETEQSPRSTAPMPAS